LKNIQVEVWNFTAISPLHELWERKDRKGNSEQDLEYVEGLLGKHEIIEREISHRNKNKNVQ